MKRKNLSIVQVERGLRYEIQREGRFRIYPYVELKGKRNYLDDYEVHRLRNGCIFIIVDTDTEGEDMGTKTMVKIKQKTKTETKRTQ